MEVVSSIQKNDIEIDLTSEDVIIEDQNSQMEIEIEHSEQNNEEKTRQLEDNNNHINENIQFQIEENDSIREVVIVQDSNTEKDQQQKKQENQQKIKKVIKKKKGTKPYTKCKICTKKTVALDDKMLTCFTCTRVFHATCLQLNLEKIPKKFQCSLCKQQQNDLKKKLKDQTKKNLEQLEKKKKKPENKEKAEQKLKKLIQMSNINEKQGDAKANEKQQLKKQFIKNFPQYFDRNNQIKSPIDDIVLRLYERHFLNKTNQNTIQKPKPIQNQIIPSRFLGDVAQVQNFFATFKSYMDCPDFTKEDLYCALYYEGNDNLDFLVEIMSSLAEAFLEEAFSFDEAFKLPPLLQILKIEKDNLGLIQYALQYLWFEIFVIFRDIPQYEFLFKDQDKANAILNMEKINDFKKLSLSDKLMILNLMINCIYEFETFRAIVQNKIDVLNEMTKEKQELLISIKQEEILLSQQQKELIELEKQNKIQEEAASKLTRQDFNKFQKEQETFKKTIQKQQAQVLKQEEQVDSKQQRLDYLQNSLPFFINSAQCLGFDADFNEYWYFFYENDKLFIRTKSQQPPIQESWFFFDQKKQILQLLNSLNTNGLREKNLHENVSSYIKNNYFAFSKDHEIIDIESNSNNQNAQEKMTSIILQLQQKNEFTVLKNPNIQQWDLQTGMQIKDIKNLITKIQNNYTKYINSMSCEYCYKQEKNQLDQDIQECEDLNKMGQYLIQLNRKFYHIKIEGSLDVEQVASADLIDDDSQQKDINKLGYKLQQKIWGYFQNTIRQHWEQSIQQISSNSIYHLYFFTYLFYHRINSLNLKVQTNTKPTKQVSGLLKQIQNNDQQENELAQRTRNSKTNEPKNQNEILLNELLKQRKQEKTSTRSGGKYREAYEDMWKQNECNICSNYDVDIKCNTCSNTFHMKCVGLKEYSDDWNCVDCLRQIQISRTTRNRSIKFMINDE